MVKLATAEHDRMRLDMTLHNPPAHPHWSESVDWRPGRWDPMANAPRAGYPILHFRVRTAEGNLVEPVHYACGDGDGLMPPFDGWFTPYGGKLASPGERSEGFFEVKPVEWQPLRAAPEEV